MGKGGEKENDEPPPLRLYFPRNYALATWNDWHRHGIYPRPGGYDAQDPALIADFRAITQRFNWHIRQLMDDDSESGELRDMPVEDLITGVSRTNWQGLIGE